MSPPRLGRLGWTRLPNPPHRLERRDAAVKKPNGVGISAGFRPFTAMDRNPQHDESYWRRRAEKTRTLADEMQVPEVRRILLDIAKSYDRLAVLAAARKPDR